MRHRLPEGGRREALGGRTWSRRSSAVAAEENAADPIRFVVLTGGEPLLQADAGLVRALHAAGFEVATETNGTVTFANAFTDEDGDSFRRTGSCVARSCPRSASYSSGATNSSLSCPTTALKHTPISPSVCGRIGWGRRKAFPLAAAGGRPPADDAVRLAIETALAHPDWRVSVQTHKILHVD